MSIRTRITAAAATALLGAGALVLTAGGDATASTGHRRDPIPSCTTQFSKAVAAYVDTTNRHDVKGFGRLVAPDYTIVLPGGTVFAGRADSMAFIKRFFARTDFTQTFTVTRKAVNGCSTALVLFDSTYTDSDGPVPLVIGLSWTYRHGRWQVVQDQNTVVDAQPASAASVHPAFCNPQHKCPTP